MTFAEAKHFKLPFGKFRGQALDYIAKTDQGLLYLDWLVGQSFAGSHVLEHLRAYLGDPTIAAEVARLTNKRRD